MGIDYKKIYHEFEQLKHEKEFFEYASELNEVNQLLSTYPFDSARAAQMCSYLTNKYENEINQQPGRSGEKMTVIKGNNLPTKTPAELRYDLGYFKDHIPVFALKREIKNEALKTLLGMTP